MVGQGRKKPLSLPTPQTNKETSSPLFSSLTRLLFSLINWLALSATSGNSPLNRLFILTSASAILKSRSVFRMDKRWSPRGPVGTMLAWNKFNLSQGSGEVTTFPPPLPFPHLSGANHPLQPGDEVALPLDVQDEHPALDLV